MRVEPKKYNRVNVCDHPLFLGKRRVLEHRLVMAEFLGRPLLRTEYVHHKHENTLDNRIDNLEIMSPKKHGAHHILGLVRSVETKKRMSIALKGVRHSASCKHCTAKVRHKISAALKGRHLPIETRRKMSSSQRMRRRAI